MSIACDLFERSCEDMQFLKNTVTGDESWVYGYDPETKQQSSQWKGPTSLRPKKGRQVRSKTKIMLLAFLDSEGIVHHEYAPDGQTINKEFCVEVLQHLCESVRRKRTEKWWDGDWILHHDNAPTHTLHILCSSFWPNTAPLSCSSHHIYQILHRVTFSYSQGLRSSERTQI